MTGFAMFNDQCSMTKKTPMTKSQEALARGSGALELEPAFAKASDRQAVWNGL